MKTTTAFAIGILATLTALQAAVAEPRINTISGNINHGSSVTIGGTGFGNKDQASPRLWDTVDNQSSYSDLNEGQAIPTGSSDPYSINTYNDPDSVKYSSSGTRHSRLSAQYEASRNGYMQWPRATGGEGGAPSDQRQLYVSFWFKPLGDIPGGGHSSKFFRVWDRSSGEGTRISWTQMHLTYDGGGPSWKGWGGRTNQWNRLEMYVDADENLIRAWTNGELKHNITNFAKNSAASGRGLNLARVGFDRGGSNPPPISFEFGEIYVDVTQARVELGNAANWDDVTEKEIQIPVSWSDNSITIELNQGGMSNFNGKYLYIVDSDGNVSSSGYPLCTDCKTPKSPDGLAAM